MVDPGHKDAQGVDMKRMIACLSAMVVGLAQEATPVIQTGTARPATLDLRHADPAALLVSDSRNGAWAPAVSAQRAWNTLLESLKASRSIRLLLPDGPERVPLLLAASQALKARNPGTKLYVAFQPNAAPILDETAWGAADGGALLPEDLGHSPACWRDRLAKAQRTFPGRPWLLWLDQDPRELAAQLLGDGGRLVVPAAGPTGILARTLPRYPVDVEGGLGDLTLRSRAAGGGIQRWVFRNGQWTPATLPKEPRHEVAVQDHDTYDVGSLLARMRATRLRDKTAIRNFRAHTGVALHFQGEGGSGDVEFLFECFEQAGEPDELVRREVRVNGVRANLSGSAQLPFVEARTSMAAPAALTLTERYRYQDGGPAGPGLRILRFEPVDADPTLCTGELTVDEATGRTLQERSRRSDLPGIVRSEQREITYGEVQPGFWRVTGIRTTERWFGVAGVYQVIRNITYRQIAVNDPGFETAREAARNGDASILRNTGDGYRYAVKQTDGSRKLEARMTSGGRAVGGMVLAMPGMEPPVVPLAGFMIYDFNAFDRGIRYTFLTAAVYNDFNCSIPKAMLGLDLTAHTTLSLLGGTERPVENGKQADMDGVERRTQEADLGLGRDLGAGFRLELKGHFTLDSFSNPKEDKYKTPGFVNPPSGWTRLGSAQLSWQHSGFQLRGSFGEGRRPCGTWGAPGRLQDVPEDGRITRWDGAAVLDRELGRGVWLNATVGQAGGRNFDRFQPIEFDGRVSGIKPYAVVADRITYGGVNVAFPTGPNLHLTLGLDHGRAHSLTDRKNYGFTGMKIAGDLPGFWWFTTVRVDLGAGLQSDVRGVRTLAGAVSFLHLF